MGVSSAKRCFNAVSFIKDAETTMGTALAASLFENFPYDILSTPLSKEHSVRYSFIYEVYR